MKEKRDQMKIKYRLIIAFTAVAVLSLLLMGIVSVGILLRFQGQVNTVIDVTTPIRISGQEIEVLVWDLTRDIYSYIEDSAGKEAVERTLEMLQDELDKHVALLKKDVEGLDPEYAQEIQENVSQLMGLVEEIVVEKEGGADAATLGAAFTNEVSPSLTKTQELLAEGAADADEALEAAGDNVSSAKNQRIVAVILSSIVVLALALLLAIYSARSITGTIAEVIESLATSTSEISTTANEVAAGASETATAVNETSVTIDEVKQVSQISTEKAVNVSEQTTKTTQVSELGRESVTESIKIMNLINGHVESIADSVIKLSEQSQSIGEIISSVNDLAEQSNLLAVNASIEAARAGEQGKGFVIVAQEIRSLAEQSKEATEQVRSILNDIQKATGSAVMATEQGSKAVEAGLKQTAEAGNAIDTLVDSIELSMDMAAQIEASSNQQFTGMDQISDAMENINQAAAQTSEGLNQLEAAARSLDELAHRLKKII